MQLGAQTQVCWSVGGLLVLAIHQPLYLSRLSETGNPGAGKTHSAVSPVVLAPSGSCNAAHAQPARHARFCHFQSVLYVQHWSKWCAMLCPFWLTCEAVSSESSRSNRASQFRQPHSDNFKTKAHQTKQEKKITPLRGAVILLSPGEVWRQLLLLLYSLYLTPAVTSPLGSASRKGKNNKLQAQKNDISFELFLHPNLSKWHASTEISAGWGERSRSAMPEAALTQCASLWHSPRAYMALHVKQKRWNPCMPRTFNTESVSQERTCFGQVLNTRIITMPQLGWTSLLGTIGQELRWHWHTKFLTATRDPCEWDSAANILLASSARWGRYHYIADHFDIFFLQKYP